MKLNLTLAACIAVSVCIGHSEAGLFRRQADAEQPTSDTDNPSAPHNQYYVCMMRKRNLCAKPKLYEAANALTNFDTAQIFLANRTNLEQAAAAAQIAKTCVQNQNSHADCQGLRRQSIDLEIDIVADYLASSEHIDLLVNFSRSVCLTNPDQVRMLRRDGRSCLAYFRTNEPESFPDACNELTKTRDCLVNKSAQWCGVEAGALVESLWDFGAQSEVYSAMLSNTIYISFSVIKTCYHEDGILTRSARGLLKRFE